MESDAKTDYLLTNENGNHANKIPWYDVPMHFVMSRLTGIAQSDDPNRLVKTSERRSLYSARYFRYTVLLFLLYLSVGLGYFNGHVGFTYLDSIYFIIIAFYTVGYGDFHPITEAQRVFTTFYVCTGFALLCVIGVTAGDVFHNAMRSSDQNLRSTRVLGMLKDARRDEPAVVFNSPTNAEVNDHSHRGTASKDSINSHSSGASVPGQRKVPSRRLSLMNKGNQGDIFPSPYSIKDPKMLELMRKVNMDMFDEELEAIKGKTKKDFIMILGILFLGSLGMGLIEGWSVADSLYWSCVTITTIGFGDRVPGTDKGKIFTILYCLVGVGLMAKAVTDLASYPFLMRAKKTELQVLMQFGTDLSEKQLKMIQDHEIINAVPKLRKKKDRVEKSEFVLILLQLMDKIQDTDIVYISEIFDLLDKTGDGHLSDQVMAKEMEHARERARTVLAAHDVPDSSRRPSLTGSIMNMFQGTPSESKRGSLSSSYVIPNTRVPFNTTPTAGNSSSSYQPPSSPTQQGGVRPVYNATDIDPESGEKSY